MSNQRGFALIVVVLIVVALLAGGIFAWQYFGALKEEVATPEQVVSQFYRCYIAERLTKRFSLESAINYCNFLEENYKQSLLGQGVHLADPIIWAQDYPDEIDIQIDKTEIGDNSTSVIISFLPKTFWLGHRVKVSLVLINNEWKIKNITEDEWQTYRNEEYGFEIKYPQDWIIINDKLPEKLKGAATHGGENLTISNNSMPEVPEFTLWINPASFGLPPVDIFYELSPNEKSGIKIKKRTEIPQTSEGMSNIDGVIIIASNTIIFGSNDYILIFRFKEGGKNYELIFNQMLSTFKFTEVDETANWQTYRDGKYEFEVKYPQDWKMREHPIDSRHKDFLKTFDEYDCIFTVYNTEDKDYYGASLQSIKAQGYYQEEIFINNTPATKLFHPKFPGKADYFLKKEENGKELYFHAFYGAFQLTEATTIIVTDHECGEIFNQMLSTFKFIGSTTKSEVSGEKYCEKDTDCACGVNIKTRECFYGNKDYVDTTQQCPDFCAPGFSGRLMLKCISNECKQVSE